MVNFSDVYKETIEREYENSYDTKFSTKEPSGSDIPPCDLYDYEYEKLRKEVYGDKINPYFYGSNMNANQVQIGGTYIELSKGYSALVDTYEALDLDKYKWSALETGHNVYAVREDDSGTFVYIHRVIMQATPATIVDHIDGNGLNNLKANLRFVNRSQNAFNSYKPKGISKYKGVWFRGDRKKKWNAEVTVEGTKIYLGAFRTENEAAQAYNDCVVKLLGNFARLNEIRE